MVDILEYTPEEENPPSLLDFLEGYPGAVKEQFMQGAKTLPKNRQAGALQMLYSPVAPTMEYFYDRVAHLLGPNLNKMWRAQHESHNRALESLGVEPQDEYQDVTRKQLRMPLAMVGSVLRGSPQWYSALRKAIKDAKQDKGPIGYWKGQIKGTPGATSESTKTGFDERLTTWGLPPEITKESIGFKEFEGNVTKDEVLGLLEPIELKETILGGEGYTVKHLTQEELIPFGLSGNNIWGVVDPEGNLAMNLPTGSNASISVHHGGSQSNLDRWNRSGRPEWYYGEADAKQAARWHNLRSVSGAARFADRQDLRTAGGTNYREILVHLPKRESSDYWYDRQNNYVQDMHKKYGNGWVNKATSEEMRTAWGFGEKAEFADGPGRNYTGGHWDQDNTLGHIRVSNITANNLKSLHSDEYQLDWWQTAEQVRRREIRRLSQALDISEKEAAKQVPKDYGYITEIEQSDPDGNIIPQTGEVPDEPFKDKGWEVLCKRHFMEAINDPDIEAITWSTGNTQADRYSLSRVFGKIDIAYSPSNGKYNIMAYPKDGGAPQMYVDIHKDDLGNYIGGELAGKAIGEMDIKEVAENSGFDRLVSGKVTYEGLDLNMGGKFLQFIYDNKAPQFYKELLKGFKMPPTRVGGEIKGYTIGSPGHGYHVPEGEYGPTVFESKEAARDYIDKKLELWSTPTDQYGGVFEPKIRYWESMTVDPVEPDEPEVWQQRITDEMREKFKEGMSLTKREETGLLGSYA